MKKIYLVLLAASVAAGCHKFDADINTNPNLPNKASGTQLIANAELSLPDLSSSPQGEYYAQFLGETQYPGASLYPDGGTSFYGWYQGPLMNLQTVLNSKELSVLEGPVNNQLAVAKILKAYFVWNITDRWGDVPYSEALKGADNFTPKYDVQKTIYDSLFKLLDEANAQIVSGNITNDIVYGGDMSKWKKLGNSIHMLIALRMSEVDPAKASAEFNKALNAGVIAANTDNLVYKHLADANNQNYWYGQIVASKREWWAVTKTLVDYMKPLSDPRLPVYARRTTTSTPDYIGIPFGTTSGVPNTTNYSLLGSAIYTQNAPVYLVTFAQVLFAKAEAAKRGWIGGGDAVAKSKYDSAVEQSIIQWTGSNAGASALLANAAVSYDATKALEQIATQRYVHLFMHGYEAWSEWRRTGYPTNLLSPGGKAIPTRLAYPPNETFNNTTNYKEATQRQFGGQDNLYGKLWWDKP